MEDESFAHVMVDCVGPLPKSRRGNEYLLTIMDVATRYPEAFPLRSVKAKTIVEHLIKFFSWAGLPHSIQSDRGSNFTSRLYQQVMAELQVSPKHSSARHPQSQGAIERFHGTLKPRAAKVQAILDFPVPQTRTQLMRVLGMCGFYRRFIPNFAAITGPLTILLRKDVRWKWSGESEEA